MFTNISPNQNNFVNYFTEKDAIYRETEKFRSKCNRAQFKSIIEELNAFLGFRRMTINKCLSTAVSVFKLNKLNPFMKICQNGTLNHTLISHVMPSGVFYDIGNYLALVFDANGSILHISKRQTDHGLPFNLCNCGSSMNQICHNMRDILQDVFEEGRPHFQMRLKYCKKDKQAAVMPFQGRILTDPESQTKIFMGFGYIGDKRDTTRDPFMFHTGCEVHLDLDFNVIKCHQWLDYLLEGAVRINQGKGPLNIMSMLHHDDLVLIDDGMQSIRDKGRFRSSCRLFDGTNYLYVHFSIIPAYKDKTKLSHFVAYVWPFGYENAKSGEVNLIDLKMLWLQKHQMVKKMKVQKSAGSNDYSSPPRSTPINGVRKIKVSSSPSPPINAPLIPIQISNQASSPRSLFIPNPTNNLNLSVKTVNGQSIQMHANSAFSRVRNLPVKVVMPQAIETQTPDSPVKKIKLDHDQTPIVSPIRHSFGTNPPSHIAEHVEDVVNLYNVMVEVKSKSPDIYDKLAAAMNKPEIAKFLPFVMSLQEQVITVDEEARSPFSKKIQVVYERTQQTQQS